MTELSTNKAFSRQRGNPGTAETDKPDLLSLSTGIFDP